jgi:hypothetical protein
MKYEIMYVTLECCLFHGAVLDTLIVIQLVKKCPSFYGTQKFITVFT